MAYVNNLPSDNRHFCVAQNWQICTTSLILVRCSNHFVAKGHINTQIQAIPLQHLQVICDQKEALGRPITRYRPVRADLPATDRMLDRALGSVVRSHKCASICFSLLHELTPNHTKTLEPRKPAGGLNVCDKEGQLLLLGRRDSESHLYLYLYEEVSPYLGYTRIYYFRHIFFLFNIGSQLSKRFSYSLFCLLISLRGSIL